MGKFQLFINDEEEPAWESEAESGDVDEIKIINARGEVTTVGSDGGDSWIRVEFNERPEVETYYDQIERRKVEERREMFEVEAEGRNTDAYVAMDEEDSEPEPMGKVGVTNPEESELVTTPQTPEDQGELETGPASQEDQKKEESMIGDTGF